MNENKTGPFMTSAMTLDAQTIERSLELVAQKCEDPTPLVYERLFAKHPEMVPLFILDENDSAKGHMLYEATECILDLLGPGAYATTLVQSERINHDGLGIPIEVFSDFFPTVKETFADILGQAWTPEIDGAWVVLLAKLKDIIAES